MPLLQPFDQTGILRDRGGVARYQALAGSLVEMLRRTADRVPTAEALVEVDGARLSYRELWDRAARVAGGLRAKGIRRGDRVALRLGNGIDWCLAFFGAQLAGAAAVPVNTRFSEAEIEYVTSDSGSSFVFLPGAELPDGPPFATEELTPGDLAAIFYTSGTTGFPKGAMTTHENFLSNMETARRVGLAPPGEFRNLVSAPLFHVTACNTQLLPTCEGGGTTVILPQFHVQNFIRTLEAERIDVTITVPAIYWLALHQPNFRDFDMSRVRRVAYGGAAAAPDLIAAILAGFPNARVSNSYGLTEVSSIATFLPGEYTLTRPDAVGLAAPVVDLRLVDVSPGGDVGELLIRGPNVVPGYWNKPEATAETFAGGWLRTGDLARLDEQGFLQIVDRKKDMVNRGGENVYCVEVESALTAHPDIFEVAVMGVPDEVMGEKVGAIVVPKPGRTVETASVIRFARERLADFKVPQYVVIRAELLPRNPGGKILKKALRQTVEWGETAAMTIDNLHDLTDKEVAVTDWLTVTQERIDRFADATDDRQWIHVDRERAEHDSPFQSTIAHGFLTLSMLSHLSRNVLPVEGVTMRVNYGLNRVRFPAPVRVNSRLRARFRLQSAKDFSGAGGSGADVTLAVTLELEGSEKPCCVAEWIVRYYR